MGILLIIYNLNINITITNFKLRKLIRGTMIYKGKNQFMPLNIRVVLIKIVN